MDIMSRNGRDQITDIQRVANGGTSPVTFGVTKMDENGIEVPACAALLSKEDLGVQ